MRTFLASMIVFLATAAFSGTANSVQASEHLGAFKLENPSNVPIHYQYRWGSSSEWQSDCVWPGKARCHYIELDENGRAPRPEVRFDCIAGDGEVTFRTYAVDFYCTSYACGGKAYVFTYSDYGRYLDLFAR